MAHDAKHRKSRKGGAVKMILIVLLILVLAAGGCLLAIRKEINGSASAGEPVSVSIQQGSGVAAIAQKLKTAGVIKYPHVFRWYAGKQARQASSNTASSTSPPAAPTTTSSRHSPPTRRPTVSG